MVGIARHYCSTTAQSLIVVPMLNCGTSAPTIGNILLAAVNFAL